MITIEPTALLAIAAGVGSFITAIGFWLRTRAESNSYADKARADGYTTQENSRADANSAMIEIAKQGNVFLEKMITVVQENTRVNGENSARMQGMTMMLDGFSSVLKNTVVGMDDLQGQFPALNSGIAKIAQAQTNLEGTIGDQFSPVVEELRGIGTRIAQTNERLTALFDEFRGAERRVIAILEPYALAQADKLRTLTATVATTTIEETAEITLKETST